MRAKAAAVTSFTELTFDIPDRCFGVRGRPADLVMWFERTCRMLHSVDAPFFPVPQIIGLAANPTNADPSTVEHTWVFVDPNPEFVIEGTIEGIEMLPAGYTVML